MLGVARARLAGLENVALVRSTVQASPFSPGLLNQLLIINTFPHLRPWAATLAACRDLLLPGGMLDIVHFSSRAELNDLHRSKSAVAEDMLPPVEEVGRLVQAAGFAHVMASEDDHHYRVRARRPDTG